MRQTTQHGKSRTRAYRVWIGIKTRCFNRNDHNYQGYGARGITMCARWAESFEAFAADMGEPPAGAQIDRIDGAGNYEPGNCRWATPEENNRNRCNNRLVTINGETKPLVAWIEQLGQSPSRVLSRIYHSGWDPVEALTAPLCQGRQKRDAS